VFNRRANDLLHINQLLSFLLGQYLPRFRDRHAPPLSSRRHHPSEDLLDIDPHLLHSDGRKDFHHRKTIAGQFQLHHSLVQFALVQSVAQLVSGALPSGFCLLLGLRLGLGGARSFFRFFLQGGKQHIQKPLLGLILCFLFHLLHAIFFDHIDRKIHQIPHHSFHVPSHVPHLGELGGLHFDERSLRQMGQTPRNLGLPHSGGADHNDVVRHNLLAEIVGHLLAPPPISQRNRHRLFGFILPDDVLIQFRYNLSWGQCFHKTSSGLVIGDW